MVIFAMVEPLKKITTNKSNPSKWFARVFSMIFRSPFVFFGWLEFVMNVYLEPKWPLFWLEKALFWRVDLQI